MVRTTRSKTQTRKTRSGKVYASTDRVCIPDKPDRTDKPVKKTTITLDATLWASARKEHPVKSIKVKKINRTGGEGVFQIDWAGVNPVTKKPWKPTLEPYSMLCDSLKEKYTRDGRERKPFEGDLRLRDPRETIIVLGSEVRFVRMDHKKVLADKLYVFQGLPPHALPPEGVSDSASRRWKLRQTQGRHVENVKALSGCDIDFDVTHKVSDIDTDGNPTILCRLKTGKFGTIKLQNPSNVPRKEIYFGTFPLFKVQSRIFVSHPCYNDDRATRIIGRAFADICKLTFPADAGSYVNERKLADVFTALSDTVQNTLEAKKAEMKKKYVLTGTVLL